MLQSMVNYTMFQCQSQLFAGVGLQRNLDCSLKNVNKVTMSAMDVICTLHDGKYSCTPFYVVFYSMFQQPVAEKVHILVNYKPLHDIVMFKDETGVVHFQTDGGDNSQIPSQEYLKMMNLKSGSNSVAFATETSQLMVNARIFLWDINEKIVVTDIDGTITRSDKRGHIYSKFGLSWHHNSVSNCFQKVYDLGYKILYLTARSISMDQSTKRYLTDLGLPLGPLLLSPKGVMEAITSEVITKESKLGKLEHLNNVKVIFPECNEVPVVAGFGNNENDEWAYKTAGIPPDHIFIVNKRSEIKVGNKATSYEVVSNEILKFFKCLVSNLKTSEEFLPSHNQETVKEEMTKIEKGEASIEADAEEERRVPHMTEGSAPHSEKTRDLQYHPMEKPSPSPPDPIQEMAIDLRELQDKNTDSPLSDRNRHLQPGGAESPTAMRIRRGKEKLGSAYHAVKTGILVEFGDLLKM